MWCLVFSCQCVCLIRLVGYHIYIACDASVWPPHETKKAARRYARMQRVTHPVSIYGEERRLMCATSLARLTANVTLLSLLQKRAVLLTIVKP